MSGNPSFFLSPEAYGRLKEKYPKFNEPWSEDEEIELAAMAADGRRRTEMSAQLQRTPGAILVKLKEMGLYVPKPVPAPWTEDDDKAVVAMYQEGASFADMATRFSRSERAIVARLIRLRMALFPQE